MYRGTYGTDRRTGILRSRLMTVQYTGIPWYTASRIWNILLVIRQIWNDTDADSANAICSDVYQIVSESYMIYSWWVL